MRLDALDVKLNGRIDALESAFGGKLDALDVKVNGRIDKLAASVDTLKWLAGLVAAMNIAMFARLIIQP